MDVTLPSVVTPTKVGVQVFLESSGFRLSPE